MTRLCTQTLLVLAGVTLLAGSPALAQDADFAAFNTPAAKEQAAKLDADAAAKLSASSAYAQQLPDASAAPTVSGSPNVVINRDGRLAGQDPDPRVVIEMRTEDYTRE